MDPLGIRILYCSEFLSTPGDISTVQFAFEIYTIVNVDHSLFSLAGTHSLMRYGRHAQPGSAPRELVLR